MCLPCIHLTPSYYSSQLAYSIVATFDIHPSLTRKNDDRKRKYNFHCGLPPARIGHSNIVFNFDPFQKDKPDFQAVDNRPSKNSKAKQVPTFDTASKLPSASFSVQRPNRRLEALLDGVEDQFLKDMRKWSTQFGPCRQANFLLLPEVLSPM